MKCKDCSACVKGFLSSKPEAYVCTGVPEPFVISNINSECTEYSYLRNKDGYTMYAVPIPNDKPIKIAFDDGCKVKSNDDFTFTISKQLSVDELLDLINSML